MATTMEPDTETPVRPAPRPSTPAARPKSSRRTVFMVMGVVLLALIAFGARKWWFGRSHVSTDNAQVDGHIVPVLGKVGGYVSEVRVAENQAVKAGDTLVVLDDRDFRARLAQTDADLAALLATVSSRTRVGQADAAVAQAQANATQAAADLARIAPLRRRRCSVLMPGSPPPALPAIRPRCSCPTRGSPHRQTASCRRSRSR